MQQMPGRNAYLDGLLAVSHISAPRQRSLPPSAVASWVAFVRVRSPRGPAKRARTPMQRPRALNDRGMPTARGSEWFAPSVRDVLNLRESEGPRHPAG